MWEIYHTSNVDSERVHDNVDSGNVDSGHVCSDVRARVAVRVDDNDGGSDLLTTSDVDSGRVHSAMGT